MEYKHYTLSKISNTLFFISSIFLLSLVWINLIIKNLNKSLICAIIITTGISIIVFITQKFKNKIKLKKQSLESQKKMLDLNLLFNNDENNIATILQAFELNNLQPISSNHFIDPNKQIDYFFCFDTEIVSNDHIIKFIKDRKYDKITIFCINHCCANQNISLEISLITSDEIFEKLSSINVSIPQPIKSTKSTKLSVKTIFCTALNKKRAKNYFLFGLMLMIFSLYTIYYTYYIIFGSFLIILAIYSKFNKTFNKKTCDNIN